MIGDLAQSAGNFATGQANQQAYLQQGQFGLQQQAAGLQQQRFQQDVQNHQDQMDLQQQQMQRGDFWNQQRYVQQAGRDQQLAQNRSDQIDQQYGYRGQQAAANNQFRGDLAQNNNDFRGGQNDLNRQSREGIAGDRNDVGYYRADQQNDLGQSRLDAMKDRWAQQVTRDPQQALAFKQQQQARILNSEQGRAMEFVIQGLHQQQSQVQRALSGINGELLAPDEQTQLRARGQSLQKQIDEKMSKFQNFWMGAGQSQPAPQQQAPYQSFTPQDMGQGNLGFDPSYGGEPNALPPATQPGAITQSQHPAAQNPQAMNLIRQMSANGYSRQQIKDALERQLGIRDYSEEDDR